jgi:hypothetical protein
MKRLEVINTSYTSIFANWCAQTRLQITVNRMLHHINKLKHAKNMASLSKLFEGRFPLSKTANEAKAGN